MKKAKTLKVILIMPHTHAGELLKPGAEIEVDEQKAAWLKRHGVIE